MSEKNEDNLWWPSVATVAAAQQCAKAGTVMASLCAVFTAGFAVAAIAGYSFQGADASSLFSAAIFASLAFGIARRSRVAAVVAPLFYVAGRLFVWSTIQSPSTLSAVLMLAFLMFFVNGARGVFALHRLTQQPAAANEDA